MKVLVTGWFSFEQMGATAGDLIARDVVCSWLDRAPVGYDVAHAGPFTGGVDWRTRDPNDYTHVVFVCGPFGNGPPLTEFLERFKPCRLVGVDLTMLHNLDEWNPFDLLLERDSSRTARPDLAFLGPQPRVPIAGVVLIHPQPEYKRRDAHQQMNGAIHRLVASREVAAVPIDTRLDENKTGLRTPGEVESLVARMDLVLTTRLHGMVLALKNGVPPVVLDPVAGGAKISRQAEALGWPIVFTPESVSEDGLERAFDDCLTVTTRSLAKETAARANALLADLPGRFLSYLKPDTETSPRPRSPISSGSADVASRSKPRKKG